MVSVFSSKLKDLQAWDSCSLVLPVLGYCCLNKFCNPYQSTFIGSNNWYHNLASPKSVEQNLWTLTPSTKWCAFIQSLVQSRCASASSSGFPENSGLKWDQFKCTICCSCCAGRAWCSWCCGACCPTCTGAGGGWRGWNTLHLLCHVLYVFIFYIIYYSNVLCYWVYKFFILSFTYLFTNLLN